MLTGKPWTRRQVLVQAGTAITGVSGLALVDCTGLARQVGDRSPVAPSGSAADGRAADVQHFVSRPDLTPPVVHIRHERPGAGAPGHFFITPGTGGPGQGGAMICDYNGGLVWFSPSTSHTSKLDFNRQTYRGQPVLTWYEGPVINGHGEGVAVIADSSYRPIHTISAGPGLKVDLHEFVITPQDTALITSFRTAPADLSALGGPASGKVWAGVVQEIDIATGRVLFHWDSLDHVEVTETYKTLAGAGTEANPFDYFHINSIAIAPDGDLIISARNTWAVYKVTRPGGAIVWRLGGRKSSFAMGPGTRFYWQHDARPHGNSSLSLFDDGATPKEERQSRGIFLNLDTATMRATLARQYVHPAPLLAGAMGNTQLLSNGNVLVGWGTEPYFSEFTHGGKLVRNGRLPASDASYRVFVQGWSGQPTGHPAAAARSRAAGGTTVHASWNGATTVATWAVLAGRSPSSLRKVATARRAGFETAITTRHSGPYFAAEARGSRGQVLARSAAVKRRKG